MSDNGRDDNRSAQGQPPTSATLHGMPAVSAHHPTGASTAPAAPPSAPASAPPPSSATLTAAPASVNVAAPASASQRSPNVPSEAATGFASGAVAVISSAADKAKELLEEVPAKQFTAFLKLSARRAFRLRIEPTEVLASERFALATANPPINDPNLSAFLAWRRSVLFLCAVALVPLTLIGLLNGISGDRIPLPIRMVRLGPAIAEGIFCLICWNQLKRWANWRRQRSKLFYGWLLFMAAPFIVFVYPLRSVFEDLYRQKEAVAASMIALGFQGGFKRSVMPYFFPMLALLQLAPKAISLMPGLVRSSMVIKLLFPGSTAPGWLIALAAPMYAIFAYTVLIIPYQLTGSIWFIVGIVGIVLGQAILARAGYRLARPLTEEAALSHLKRVRTWYLTVMIASGLLIVVAMWSVVTVLSLHKLDVLLAILKFETNVLLITMIGSDLVITNLDRARNYTEGGEPLEEHAEQKIAAFVGLDRA